MIYIFLSVNLRKLSADLHVSITSFIVLALESLRVSFISIPGVGMLILKMIFSETGAVNAFPGVAVVAATAAAAAVVAKGGVGVSAKSAGGGGEEVGVGDRLPCAPMCEHARVLLDFFAGTQLDLDL